MGVKADIPFMGKSSFKSMYTFIQFLGKSLTLLSIMGSMVVSHKHLKKNNRVRFRTLISSAKNSDSFSDQEVETLQPKLGRSLVSLN